MRNPLKTEPAVLIGGLVSLFTYIQAEIGSSPGEPVDWRALLPLAVGFIIRWFVYSPATVADGEVTRALADDAPPARKTTNS